MIEVTTLDKNQISLFQGPGIPGFPELVQALETLLCLTQVLRPEIFPALCNIRQAATHILGQHDVGVHHV